MAVLLSDTGKAGHGTLKTFTFTQPTPRETTASLTLPTTEPGTPQISYTAQSSDFVSISPAPLSVINLPIVHACGKIGASATVISYRILINGVSQAQGSFSSMSAGLFYTLSLTRNFAINLGDTVTISLWSNQADTTLVYHSFYATCSRVQLAKSGVILKDVAYAAGVTNSLTLAPTPIVVNNTTGFSTYPTNRIFDSILFNTAAITYLAMLPNAAMGYHMFRCGYGDITDSVANLTHATNQTIYNRNYIPASISFREVLR